MTNLFFKTYLLIKFTILTFGNANLCLWIDILYFNVWPLMPIFFRVMLVICNFIQLIKNGFLISIIVTGYFVVLIDENGYSG